MPQDALLGTTDLKCAAWPVSAIFVIIAAIIDLKLNMVPGVEGSVHPHPQALDDSCVSASYASCWTLATPRQPS